MRLRGRRCDGEWFRLPGQIDDGWLDPNPAKEGRQTAHIRRVSKSIRGETASPPAVAPDAQTPSAFRPRRMQSAAIRGGASGGRPPTNGIGRRTADSENRRRAPRRGATGRWPVHASALPPEQCLIRTRRRSSDVPGKRPTSESRSRIDAPAPTTVPPRGESVARAKTRSRQSWTAARRRSVPHRSARPMWAGPGDESTVPGCGQSYRSCRSVRSWNIRV